MKRERDEGKQQDRPQTGGLLGFYTAQCDTCVLTSRRNVVPPSSGWFYLIDVDAYATWRKIKKDHQLCNNQRENLKAYNAIDLFLT
jgi:hypothetical protein